VREAFAMLTDADRTLGATWRRNGWSAWASATSVITGHRHRGGRLE
jgi:hypothetical protein